MLINSNINYYNNYSLKPRQEDTYYGRMSNISYLGKGKIMNEVEKKYSQYHKEFNIDKAIKHLRDEIQYLPNLMDSIFGDSVIYLSKNCEVKDFVTGYKSKVLDLIHKITSTESQSYNIQFAKELTMIKNIYSACLDLEKNSIDKRTFDSIVEKSIHKYCKTKEKSSINIDRLNEN